MQQKSFPQVRTAVLADKKEFRRLWKICFGDSDAFCDWFFENRFCPSYSVCLEEQGEMASCMQAFPYEIFLRGKVLSGAMLCGVSTHPAHRKKGYMGKIFRFEMNLLREKGCLLAVHTPAVLDSYFSFGHLPVADAAYLESEKLPALPPSPYAFHVKEKDWESLFPLYETFSRKYSGSIARKKEDFLRKAADYAADGGQCLAYIEKDEIKAYSFFYRTEEKLTASEVVAEDGYYHLLLEALFHEGEGCAFSAKLPPQLYLSYPFARIIRQQKGVMGLVNLSALLAELALPIPYSIEVWDNVISENNGVFDFSGKISEEMPVFAISAGHLLQILVGYRSLEELRDKIQIKEEAAFKEIDRLIPKCNCYIIDEY